MTNTKTNPVGEFFDQKSMLTPGIAGGITMAITNALCSNFALPRPVTALVLSFLLGLLMLALAAATNNNTNTMAWWGKALVTFFNSLFIFAMAVGTSTLGAAQAGPPGQASLHTPTTFVASTAYLHEWGGPRKNGEIVKATGPSRYLIENGVRRLIPDDDTFKAMGVNKVTTIPDSELESIPLGKPLPSKRFFSPWFN